MKAVSIITSVFTLQALLMPVVWAQELANTNSVGSYSWEAIKVVISLAIVLGAFYLLVNVFKKYTGINIKSDSTMRIVGGLSLGGKDKLVILNTGETNLLLGISAAGITKLHQFDGDQSTALDEDNAPNSSFGEHIEKIIGKKKS